MSNFENDGHHNDPPFSEPEGIGTPTSTSSRMSNAQTVLKKKPVSISRELQRIGGLGDSRRPTNLWQKLSELQTKARDNPTSSTPRVSPVPENLGTPNMNDINENDIYAYTPLQESAGVMLIARPTSQQDVMSDEQALEAITKLENELEQMQHLHDDDPQDYKAANAQYKDLLIKLNKIRVVATAKESDDLISRCSRFGVRLESLKIKWCIQSNNNSLSSGMFNGFTSVDIEKAAANIPTANNNLRQITELKGKIKSLEYLATSVNSVTAKLPQIEEQIQANLVSPLIMQRIEKLEAEVAFSKNANETIKLLSSKVSNIELQLATLNNNFNSQRDLCLTSASCQRDMAKEFASFQLSVRNDIDTLQNTIEMLISSADTRVQDAGDQIYVNNNNVISGNIQMSGELGNMAGNIGELHNDYVDNWLRKQPNQGISNKKAKCSSVLSENSEDNIESVMSTSLDVYGKSLKRQMKALGNLLVPEPCSDLDKATIIDIYKNQIPTIDLERRDLQKSLRDYFKMRNINVSLCDQVEICLERADIWCSTMRRMYLNKGFHKKSQTHKLYDTLPKFTSTSDIDIFEFLRRFENLTSDYEISIEKAELFYSRYLSSSIQDEVVKVRENYNKMKELLLLRYGDFETITSSILSNVSKEKIPTDHTDLGANLSYFRKLQSALERIDKLVDIPDVSSHEVEDFIYGHEFLKRILQLVPVSIIDTFVQAMRDLNQGITRIRGKTAFKTILCCISTAYEKYDSMARNTDFFNAQLSKSRKDKSKTPITKQVSHIENAAEDSCQSDDEKSNDESNDDNVKTAHFQVKSKKVKPCSEFKFPCIIKDHKHDISECVEFYLLTPKERVEYRKNFKFKYCTQCLQSNDNCFGRRCNNLKDTPKILQCIECKARIKNDSKGYAYSIFFCFNDKHTKPQNAEILSALEGYIKGFKSNSLNVPVNLACHLQVFAGTKGSSKSKSLSRPVSHNEPAPVFNTSTGLKEDPSPVDLVSECNEDSIGVMQLLSIGGKQLLTLFDRGANQHLIDGETAENLNIKVVNQNQGSIGVISGSRIMTGYGMYELYLGPTVDGKYHQLTCQGMKSITGPFPKYNLDELNNEAREYADINPETPLPPYVGGDSIKLLIGLKHSELEPICMLSLPNGIGLYKSPFMDVFGSVYCFGGPHRIFTDINKKLGGNVNHFYSYFTEVVNQYRGSPYAALKSIFDPELVDTGHGVYQYKDDPFVYDFKSSTGEIYYTTPLSIDDIEELDHSCLENLEPINTTDCPLPHCVCPPHPVALRARIPLSKQRIHIDESDKNDLVNFRCEKCLKCKCASNSTAQMLSITEQIEQEAIEKSVTVNLEEKKVFVDLPFTTDPDKYLSKRHGNSNNYNQALKVYKSQCRLPESKKEHIRNVISELVQKNFLSKIEDLPKEHLKLVEASSFHHYMPWRTVAKESTSTPLRIVVDPSMSGLNLILAKGCNNMNRLTDVLLKARTKKFVWSSDISKLYNCLKLKPTSYAYQLFLFKNDLDTDVPPDTYVMTVAWYGVTPSANQAIFALKELARLLSEGYPLAYVILLWEIYVDDIMGGANSIEECEKQIDEVTAVLNAGGFSLKYVVMSGGNLDGNANLKVLGYNWNITNDTFSPGFSEINFNKKKRGIKAPNLFPISTIEDVNKLLSNLEITRRVVVSKVAEYWEPVGIWEPYNCQLKLSAQALNGLNWDTPLDHDIQEHWRERFKEFIQIPQLSVRRFVFPENTKAGSKIRLLCISDAAACMGGAAIYAGVKLSENEYSCQLLTSKSKIMSNSVPRNELESIRLATTTLEEVLGVFGDMVSEVYFFTDSQVALSWCSNTEKKLRLFVLNRVTEIRRVMLKVPNKSDQLPLFHIDGNINIADLLTKPNNITPTDLHSESVWIQGYPWMRSDLSQMPITKFTDIQLNAQQRQLLTQECYPDIVFPNQSNIMCAVNESQVQHCINCQYYIGETEVICYGTTPNQPHCLMCNCVFTSVLSSQVGSGSLSLVDNIIHHGYDKSISIMSRVYDFIWSAKHKAHQGGGINNSWTCEKCVAIKDSAGIPMEYKKILKRKALDYFLRNETTSIMKILPKKKIAQFQLKDGILYMSGRLSDETKVTVKELDYEVFFDNVDIKGTLPVVSSESDFFYALLMHIHQKVRKHSGIEITMREILKHVYPIHNPRRIIQKVRQNCSRCRMLLRKTRELTMGNHPNARFTITPAFYHCMMDICYGFKGKPHFNARNNCKTTVKIYALVIVCLLTSATNILALESIETQQIVLALERHSSRHGVPSAIFVDCGTQLTSLKTLEMNLRDAHHQLRESVGLEIHPSTAKSHEERGRVERRIRTLREMLVKTATNTNMCMTPLEWETVFSKMASEIDDVPIAKADRSESEDPGWELLTPNRFKLGRANNRAIEGPMSISPEVGPTQLLRRVQDIQSYWYQLLLDRLHHLIPRPNKWCKTDPITVGDVVIFKLKDNNSSKLEKWVTGKVSDIQREGRRILCSYPTSLMKGSKVKWSSVMRSPRDICIVSAASDIPLNSKEFFEKIKKIVIN